MNTANDLLGISRKRIKYNTLRGKTVQLRKKYKNAISERVQEKVKSFLEEDIHSRLLPGKGDTITRKKVKKQKRILSESLKTLHKKFTETDEDMKVSYAMFCKLKPFWILDPKCGDRDTCTCI